MSHDHMKMFLFQSSTKPEVTVISESPTKSIKNDKVDVVAIPDSPAKKISM